MKRITVFSLGPIILLSVICCSKSNSTEPEKKKGLDLPPVFSHFIDDVNIYVDGDYVVLETSGLPNHSSPYWGPGHSLYETPHSGMIMNPNRIAELDLVYRIPLNPEVNSSISATQLGPIGIAINGVALFNQYAGPNQPLDREIVSFDRYNGHPQQFGQYHYHMEPVYLSADSSSLVGFLLDGFAVYGRKDMDGSYPDDLDAANGHFGVTADYPEGTYHYHVTLEEPYISGGYKGTPGAVSF